MIENKIKDIQTMLNGLFNGGDVTEAARSSLQYTINEAMKEVSSSNVILDVVGQSEQLKAFADYAQKRMWQDGDKDLSEFVDEFLKQ